jgi:hypothetical protein
LVNYAFVGGIAGFIVGIAMLFLLSIFYSEGMGLPPGACTELACATTLLLSQPAGLSGMIVGATVGLVAGGVVYYVHHHAPRYVHGHRARSK